MTRRHWLCSLRQIGKALDRPLELVPARWTAVRIPVGRLHHHPLGITAKTLANHRANVKAALRWFTGETGGPARGAPVSADWVRLRDSVENRGARARLYGLMRFCSAKQIAPSGISDAVLESYLAYRIATSSLSGGVGAHRMIARTWNTCATSLPGWPALRLTEPALQSREAGPSWDAFPIRVRNEIDAYLDTLTRIRRTASGKRRQPSKSSTIRDGGGNWSPSRGRPFILASRSANWDRSAPSSVRIAWSGSWTLTGVPKNSPRRKLSIWPGSFTPSRGKRDASVRRPCSSSTIFALGLRSTVARASPTSTLRSFGRSFSGSVWPEVVNLPYRLMAEARGLREDARVKAALMAQKAVGIALLTFAPIRCGNLASIKLEQNLIRPGGPDHSSGSSSRNMTSRTGSGWSFRSMRALRR